jgi:TonB family protein
MFANLIESQSHGKEFKRRGRFVIATAAAYTVLFFVAGIVSIYAYDARVEAQTSELELLNWVPPVAPTTPKPPRDHQPIRRQNQPNAPVDQHITIPERTDAFAPATDPTKVPDHAGTQAQPVPPVIGEFRLGTRNVNPPVVASGSQDTCVTCSGPARVVVDTTPPPMPQPVKPPTQRLTSIVLASKAISLPQPPYPTIAKQARIQGQVNIQILVDERGTVISAQVVSGNPMLTYVARDAAMRARFTPTLLSGSPVKVQGTIIYNFVLQ